jgi:hypothetical protein
MNKTEKKRLVISPRHVIYAVICLLPVVLTILYYVKRSDTDAMDRATERVAAPVRGFLSLINSIYPFSLMEVLCFLAGLWVIYFLIIIIVVIARGKRKIYTLLRRLLTIVVVCLYVWSLFCWLWNSGYHARGFAEKNGFIGGGVSVEELTFVTYMFAEKANELAPLVERDEDGFCIEDRRELFDISPMIYQNIAAEYPSLEGRLFKPKPMMFSWLMGRTGYSGVYFALTGESNINTRAPVFLMPATIAHELAHQRGVTSEDEANFVGILASITSEYPAYEYAGYIMGLIYLQNALYTADYDAWADVSGSYCDEIKTDLKQNNNYWESEKTADTGLAFLDNILISLTKSVSDTVDSVYDGYLKSQDQPLGIKSYGACVDLLVEYYYDDGN